MKASPLELAQLFNEAGLFDAQVYSQETEENKEEQKPKSLWKLLNQDGVAKSFVELMTTELELPFKVKETSGLRSALSQPLHLTDEEIKTILKTYKPPLDEILALIDNASTLPDTPEAIRKDLGKEPEAYDLLIDRGYLQIRNLKHTVGAMRTPVRKMNRLLLCLSLLKAEKILPAAQCDTILEGFLDKGDDAIPVLNQKVIDYIESQPEMPEIEPDKINPPATLLKSFPAPFMRQNLFLPHRRSKGGLEIVASDPLNMILADTLSLLTALPVTLLYTPSARLMPRTREILVDKSSERRAPSTDSSEHPMRRASDQSPSFDEITDSRSTVDLVSSIIDGGVQHGATDIHLEPLGDHLRVRYRIDGLLHRIMEVPAHLCASVVSRLKVLSNLNVTERRRPQDGHFSLNINDNAFDFRVSILPTHIGEKTVIRILDESRVLHSLESLGMEPNQCKTVEKWIRSPHGLVLVTGPTGAGKSSTLYAALNTLNDETKNIVTIEDPVEYRLEGINQVQVESSFDLGFASGLRSILRQDPDIIMIGEIRDPETARIALRASLTGHMVFSTIHTNTAAGVIASLGQMSIEPYMIISALTGIVSQRLLRILCPECKKRFKPKKELLQSLELDPLCNKRPFKAVGCAACINSGYKGRTGVYEIMPVSGDISKAILAGKSELELQDLTRESGYRSLLEYGTQKIWKGITSPQEVLETLISEE